MRLCSFLYWYQNSEYFPKGEEGKEGGKERGGDRNYIIIIIIIIITGHTLPPSMFPGTARSSFW